MSPRAALLCLFRSQSRYLARVSLWIVKLNSLLIYTIVSSHLDGLWGGGGVDFKALSVLTSKRREGFDNEFCSRVLHSPTALRPYDLGYRVKVVLIVLVILTAFRYIQQIYLFTRAHTLMHVHTCTFTVYYTLSLFVIPLPHSYLNVN